MSKPGARHRLRFGIVIHGAKLWISEPIALLFVVVLAISLLAACCTILLQETAIRRNERHIASLKAGHIEQSFLLEELRQKDQIAAALLSFTNGRINRMALGEVVGEVLKSGRQFGYDPLLVLAVIHVESYFSSDARGRYRTGELSGALGLMQLKYETAQLVAANLGIRLSGPSDLLRPEINVPLGIAYLTQLIASFKSLQLGLLAYNLGPATIKKTLSERGQLPMRYYERVLRSYYRLRESASAAKS